jgi:hypothetical protein
MENNKPRVTARELFDLILDTNIQITTLSNKVSRLEAKNEEKRQVDEIIRRETTKRVPEKREEIKKADVKKSEPVIEEEKPLSFGSRLSLLIMVFGVALLFSVVFPSCIDILALNFSTTEWSCTYLIYAAFGLSVAFLAKIPGGMRFVSAVIAVAPLFASILVNR